MNSSIPPRISLDRIVQRGIGRLAYAGLILLCMAISFLAFYFLSYLVDNLAVAVYGVDAFALAFWGVLSALRLLNIGYKRSTLLLYTVLLFIPFVGLYVLGMCLFKSANSASIPVL